MKQMKIIKIILGGLFMKKYILLLAITFTLFGNQGNQSPQEKDQTKQLNTEKIETQKKETTEKTSETEKTTEGKSEKTDKTEKAEKTLSEKNIKLDKNPYCHSPVGRHQFYEMNNKGEYRSDIKFKYCMFNNEKYENIIVGIIATDLNSVRDYIKKYPYLHLEEGTRIRQNSEKKNYYYDGRWAWSSSSEYPSSIFEKNGSAKSN